MQEFGFDDRGCALPLQENSGLSLQQAGCVGWIPFLAADIGGIASANWSDRRVRRGVPPLLARKRRDH